MKSGTTRSRYSLKSLMMSGCAALALWLGGGAAFAQTAPATDQAPAEISVDAVEIGDEIVVTLERREQKLQDFAGTAVVKSQDQLDKLGVGADFQSIQQIVPGLNISFNEGFTEIFLRGIGSQDSSSTSEQPTAVHYNGVYIPRSRGIGPLFFDLSRIEVNVGPQGTLRGRNATAGTINIIPQKPILDEWEAKGSFGFGSFGLREYDAAVNVPIGDKLAIRGAYFSRAHENYFRNALEGLTFAPSDGAGSEDEEAFRISVLYTPTNSLTLEFVYDNLSQGGTGFPGNFQGQAQSRGFTPQNNPVDPFLQNFLTPGFVDNKINSYIATANWDFGPAAVEFIAGYREYSNLTVNQRRPFQFGTPNPTALPGDVDAVITFDPDNFNTNYISDDDQSLTLEARIYSANDARFRWSLGGFYLNENQAEFRWDTSDRQFFFNNLGGPDFFATGNDSFSFYGDGTFDVTEKFRVKAGIRYTNDSKTRSGYEIQFNFNPALFSDFNGDGTLDADDLRFSTPGFEIVRAGDQQLLNPATATAADFFNNFVARFGGRDSVDDVLALNPNAAVVTSTSNLGLFTQTIDEGYVDWRVGAEYDLTPNNLVYATISTGTRSGGINNPILVAGERINETFNNENLLAFEIGTKNTFVIGGYPLNFNVSGFYYRFRDQVLQVAATADGGAFEPGAVNVNANLQVQNINAGRSRIFGLTLEGSAKFPYGFLFDWNATYLNAEFSDALISDGRQLARDTNGDGVQDLAPPNINVGGNKLLFTSPLTLTATFGQDLNVPWGSAYWRFTTSYRGEFFSTPFNSQGFDINGNPTALENLALTPFGPAQGLGDGRFFNDRTEPFAIFNVTWGSKFGPDQRFSVDGYVTNLTNTAYNQRQIINAFVNIGFINPPRVIGGRFSAKF